MNKPKISLHRMPRSGSTLAKRALMLVCDFEYCQHSSFKSTAPLVVTVRDFRDVAYSQWRIHFDHMHEPDKHTLTKATNLTLRRYNAMSLTAKSCTNVVMTWMYEDMYNDPEAVCRMLGRIAGRDLTVNEIQAVQRIVQVENVIEEQDRLPDTNGRKFDVVDADGVIHKNHIGPHRGQPGAWKHAIPDEYHDWLNEKLKIPLEEWGYMGGNQ